MRVRKGYVFLIGILVLIGTASALIPNVITITSSADGDSHMGWLVANGTDQTTLLIAVENITVGGGGNTPVGMADVAFVFDTSYGTVIPSNLITDITTGQATAIFRTNKTANDNLTLIVNASNTEGSISGIKTLQIDHDKAYFAYFDYLSEVVVDQTTPFIVTLKDRWGNRVDNKNTNKIHMVKFHMYPPPGGLGTGGLKNATSGYLPLISDHTDVTGNISLTAKVDTIAGENNIWMEHIESIPDQYPFIVGISQGVPFRITTEVSPGVLYVPVDGSSVFYLKYTIYDKFGNPTGNRSIWINTTIGETYFLRSNSLGEVQATYGPKDATAKINITAIVVDNTSLSSTLTVEFINTAAMNFILTASPETMPSRDKVPAFTSQIKSKVMDIKGNRVAGENVMFTLGPVTYDGTYNTTFTSDPIFSPVSAITDTDGYAIVPFQPGGFSTNQTDLNYNPTSTGHAVVNAMWNGTSKNILLTWKNYPYLSVETEVDPPTVAVNGTVDVTIRLKGDGWALMPDPIDVVLVTDVSGSMAGAGITGAKNAGKVFATRLSAQDRIGLESYGWNAPAPWTAKAQDDLYLTFDKSTVNATINTYAATGNTPMRPAIYNATRMIKNDPRVGAVKAMILLTDGNWNYCGDPRGISTSYTRMPFLTPPDVVYANQSVVTFAKVNGIKIFTVGLGSGINAAELRAYANETGGKYYYAPNASQLTQIYIDIAGELMTSAGVNTTMMNKFENVQVNNVSMPGADVFKYIYDSSASTRIAWQNGTVNGGATPPAVDQSGDWNDDHNLNFTIGEIKLGEMWECTFRLQVLKDGNIDVFGDNSILSFNGAVGPSTLPLPHTFITSVPNLNSTGMNQSVLDISNLHTTAPGVIKDFIPLEWQINYNGNGTVTERISYSNTGGTMWVPFDLNFVNKSVFTDHSSLDVRLLPPGEYWIRVDATAPDAPSDRETTMAPITVGTAGRAYIKLE